MLDFPPLVASYCRWGYAFYFSLSLSLSRSVFMFVPERVLLPLGQVTQFLLALPESRPDLIGMLYTIKPRFICRERSRA